MPDAPDSAASTAPRERPLVSIAELRAADVEFAWFEALAVVVTLCHGVVETADETALLSESTVFVAAEGGVTALVGTHEPTALVALVGALLRDLLPDFHRRLTFHSVIGNTQAEPPQYASLDELARVLAPFGRPNPDAIVQDLYRRWEDATLASRQAAVLATAPKPIEIHRPPPPPPSPAPPTARPDVRRIAAIGGIAVACVASVAIAATLWARVAHADRAQTSAAIDQASIAGILSDIELPTPDSTPEPFVGPMPSRRLMYSATAVDISGGALPTTNASASIAQDGPGRGASLPDGSGSTSRDGATGTARDGHEAGPSAPADHIYTAADRDVTPPTPSTQQQLWSVPGSRQGDSLLAVEIIVDEQGRVASARGAQRPAHVSDTAAVAMSLSAIKSWRFNPAVKDGRPVRYRQILSIALR